MNAQTSRRHLLKGAAMLTAVPVSAIGAVPVFGVVGEPEPVETPIQSLFHQWRDVQAMADAAAKAAAAEGLSIQEQDQVWETFQPERHRIEDEIRDRPAVALADLAVKVMVLSGDGTWGVPNALILECARIAGRDFADLPRCVFEADA